MARVLIELPKETLEALHELAGIIKQDPEEKDQLAVLLRRCVRTYEWIVYQQSHGKTIAATTPDEIQYLRDGGFTEESDFVERLFPPDKEDQVHKYFEKAA